MKVRRLATTRSKVDSHTRREKLFFIFQCSGSQLPRTLTSLSVYFSGGQRGTAREWHVCREEIRQQGPTVSQVRERTKSCTFANINTRTDTMKKKKRTIERINEKKERLRNKDRKIKDKSKATTTRKGRGMRITQQPPRTRYKQGKRDCTRRSQLKDRLSRFSYCRGAIWGPNVVSFPDIYSSE